VLLQGLYVELTQSESVYDEFAAKLAAAMDKFVISNGFDPEV
jgi:acyl-CoA reductase-like NAD-dependent aldehyde dehydrogenase